MGALIAPLASGVIALILVAVLWFSSITASTTTWIVVAGVAWLLAGVVGISLLSLYFTAQAKARTRGVSIVSELQSRLYYVTLVVLGIGVVASAVEVALWFSKL